EKLSKSTRRRLYFGTCCLSGKIKIPYVHKPPWELLELFNGSNIFSSHFLSHITSYNNAFAMASLSAQTVHHGGGGPPVFTLQGELRHMHGGILPAEGENPRFAQTYFVSNEAALNFRVANLEAHAAANPNRGSLLRVNREVMSIIQDVLYHHNIYIQIYQTAWERLQQLPEAPDLHFQLKIAPGADQRRYNLPTAEEVAIILPGDGAEEVTSRDVIVFQRAGVPKCIVEFSPSYIPLYYVLLFAYGESGWMTGIPHTNPNTGEPVPPRPNGGYVTVTQMEYWAFHLHTRPSGIESNHIFLARGLFQRLIVDVWAATDQARLNWMRHNQKQLRAEVYSGVVDAVNNGDADLGTLGTRLILPSSYIGGSRSMFQLYQ
ncbi:hypothetical protein FA15DRAFT_559332, partial [Coprinopsis marcescibilis]